nr:hypothetical protein [Bacteroidota bacterium]
MDVQKSIYKMQEAANFKTIQQAHLDEKSAQLKYAVHTKAYNATLLSSGCAERNLILKYGHRSNISQPKTNTTGAQSPIIAGKIRFVFRIKVLEILQRPKTNFVNL